VPAALFTELASASGSDSDSQLACGWLLSVRVHAWGMQGM